MILNETPIRTSKNFNANNIEINDIEIPTSKVFFKNRNLYINSEKEKLFCGETIEDESRLNDIYEDGKILISELTQGDFKLKYGVGKDFNNSLITHVNQPLRIEVKENCSISNVQLDFLFDEENNCLIDNIEIIAKENSSLNITVNYIPKKFNEELSGVEENTASNIIYDESSYFHSGIVKIHGEKNSNININIVNLLTNTSNNFFNIENELDDESNLIFNIVDFGGKNSISNYFSSLNGANSNNELNTIYLGSDNQLFDLNYLINCKGEKTNANVEVQGALKDNAVKHFKGTIDFKKGCKKSVGNENESCLLLSDKARSLALPMLLCSEEDVVGNHSSSSGKVDAKELFYLMTRGFSEKDAMKLLVQAKFNTFLEQTKSDDVKKFVLFAIESKL